MISISEYMNENLNELVFELKSETYLNAAKKAKKLGDPRAEKFLQAFKDNIDKELMDMEGPDDEEKKFNIYYNADKKSMVRLKNLSFLNFKNLKPFKTTVEDSLVGPYLNIANSNLEFSAMVYIETNKSKDRQIFLRQSIIKNGNWNTVASKFDKIGEKINDSEAKKPFTYIRLFTTSSSIDFFYIIDTDNFIPVSLRQNKEKYKDDDCLDHYTEGDKTVINTICKAINQNHKDI